MPKLHEMTEAEVLEAIAERHAAIDSPPFDPDARGPRDAYIANRKSWKFYQDDKEIRVELVCVPEDERDDSGLPWWRWQFKEVSQ